MTAFHELRRLARDCRGAAIIEFAIAGPPFVLLLIGVFQIALQVQNYNALKSVASDVGRYVLIEYQKDNRLNEGQIEAKAYSLALHAPYMLKNTDLDVEVSSPASRITGADEFNIKLSYGLPDWLIYAGIKKNQISYERSIFVPTA